MPKTPKRPRDLNQWAKRMVDLATGETSAKKDKPAAPKKSRPRKRPLKK
jgi:hypothetical protein